MSQSPQNDEQDQPEEPKPGAFPFDSDMGAHALDSALRLIPPPLAAAARAAVAQPFQVDDLQDIDIHWDGTFTIDDALFGTEDTEYLRLEPAPSPPAASVSVPPPQITSSEVVSGPHVQSEQHLASGSAHDEQPPSRSDHQRVVGHVTAENDATPASRASSAPQGSKMDPPQMDALASANVSTPMKRSLPESMSISPPSQGKNVARTPPKAMRTPPRNVDKRARPRSLQTPVAKSSPIPIAPRGQPGSSAKGQMVAKQEHRPMQTTNSAARSQAPGLRGEGQVGTAATRTDQSPASKVSRDSTAQGFAGGFAQQQSNKSPLNLNQPFALGLPPHAIMPVMNTSMYPLQHHQSMFPPPSPQQVVSPTDRKDQGEATSTLPTNAAPGAGEHKKMRVGDPPVSASSGAGVATAAVSQHQQMFPPGIPMPPPGMLPIDPSMMPYFMTQQMYLAAAAAAAARYPPGVVGPMHLGNQGIPAGMFPPYGMAGSSSAPGPSPSKKVQESTGGNAENNTGGAPMRTDFVSQAQVDGRVSGVSEEGPSITTPQESFVHVGQQPKFERLHLHSMGRKIVSTGSSSGKVGSMRMTDTQGTPHGGSPPKTSMPVGVAPSVKGNPSSQAGSSSRAEGDPARPQKKRLVWTPKLHERFLKAIDLVGLQQAVPKMLVNIMNVDGLTTEHVKSHLQKYRNSIRKEQAEEAKERNQVGTQAGRGVRVTGTGGGGGFNRAGLGVGGVAGGIRKFPVLGNRISLFGTPTSAEAATPSSTPKAPVVAAGSSRQNPMVPRSTTRTSTLPPSRPNATSPSQNVAQRERQVIGTSTNELNEGKGMRPAHSDGMYRGSAGMGRTAPVQDQVTAAGSIDQEGGQRVAVAGGNETGANAMEGPGNGDGGPNAEAVGRCAKDVVKDDNPHMMDIDLIDGSGNAQVMGVNENGPSILDNALDLNVKPSESVAGSSGAGQSGQLTGEQRELQLELMNEKTLQMQLELQRMVYRTMMLEKKLEQEASEQMRDEASAGAATSGRSVRDGDGGNGEGGIERKDSGMRKSGKRESGEFGADADVTRSEVAALLKDQAALEKDLEKNREMISKEQKRLQPGGKSGDGRNGGHDRRNGNGDDEEDGNCGQVDAESGKRNGAEAEGN